MAQVALKPIAVTMGEPAGIGPQIIAHMWRARQSLQLPPFVVFGIPQAFTALSDAPTLQILESAESFDMQSGLPLVTVTDHTALPPVALGQLNDAHAQSVIAGIDQAVASVQGGLCSAVTTAPIHKRHLVSAGFQAPGHTEYLAQLCGRPNGDAVMMLTAEDLRTVLATVHIPLKDVASALNPERIRRVAHVTAHDLRLRFGIPKPRLALAALNPHAGEEGLMGLEEATHLLPVLHTLQDEGLDITGPHPADSLFHAEARASYDAVICLYHDQALIPVKTLDFWGGVNITLGLPIIRTSPDHGTALDIADEQKARPDSFINALRAAAEMVRNSV